VAKTDPELNYARYYNRWNAEGPETETRQLDFFSRLLDGLRPEAPTSPVLDVGCGCGHLLEVLRRDGCTDLLGIDRDPVLVDTTRKRGIPAERVVDAVDFLEAHSGRYALICACDVLEHIPRDRQLRFCIALARALQPGGQVLLTVPNANSTMAARWRYNDLTHHASFTESSLDHLLFLGGFWKIEIGGFELMAPPPNWRPSFWLARWLILGLLRKMRRLEMMAEFGRQDGSAIPLTPNLRATARVKAP
jgi:SAM-dependent methyltransferase